MIFFNMVLVQCSLLEETISTKFKRSTTSWTLAAMLLAMFAICCTQRMAIDMLYTEYQKILDEYSNGQLQLNSMDPTNRGISIQLSTTVHEQITLYRGIFTIKPFRMVPNTFSFFHKLEISSIIYTYLSIFTVLSN